MPAPTSIAVVNQKGGVGKTTTAVNLGHALALRGNRVMLIDLDPQGQLATCLGLFRAPRKGMDSVLLRGATLSECAVATRELIDLVPAGEQLQQFEYGQGGVDHATRLREVLQADPPDADFLIFDCPPSAGMVVANAVVAVDLALIPVVSDHLSLTGLARLMLTIKRLEGLRERSLEKWIFLNRFVPRRRLSKEAEDKLAQHFARFLLHTRVREAAVLAECAGAGRSIFEYRPRSPSAVEFAALAEELLRKRIAVDDREQIRHGA